MKWQTEKQTRYASLIRNYIWLLDDMKPTELIFYILRNTRDRREAEVIIARIYLGLTYDQLAEMYERTRENMRRIYIFGLGRILEVIKNEIEGMKP